MVVRQWTQADIPLVYDAWMRKLRLTPPWSRVPTNWFYAAQRSLINHLLSNPEVMVQIACDPDKRDQAFGFCVGEPANKIMHWVYTKDLFRRAGVATRLLADMFGMHEITATVCTSELRFLKNIRVDGYALTERVS